LIIRTIEARVCQQVLIGCVEVNRERGRNQDKGQWKQALSHDSGRECGIRTNPDKHRLVGT
jgi:hypothetical protein